MVGPSPVATGGDHTMVIYPRLFSLSKINVKNNRTILFFIKEAVSQRSSWASHTQRTRRTSPPPHDLESHSERLVWFDVGHILADGVTLLDGPSSYGEVGRRRKSDVSRVRPLGSIL